MSIVDLCEEGSVVLNIDADDQLIGRQVMKLLNALYQSSSKWFIYSNFVQPVKGRNLKGISKKIPP